jgi:hypothetical protein
MPLPHSTTTEGEAPTIGADAFGSTTTTTAAAPLARDGGPPHHAALLDPAFHVAPTLALLVSGWGEAADDAARARWIQPLLPLLAGSDGGESDGDPLTAPPIVAESRRAGHAATGVVVLAGAVREVHSGLDALLREMRRRQASGATSALARFDALCAAFAHVEFAGQTAFRQARLARAAATVASAPTAALAREQLVIQARALGHPLVVRPEGAMPPDATGAWADAWSADDPRAGAACFAATHAAQVARVALAAPEVRADAVHASLARTVLRMAGEGRTATERARMAERLADGPLAEFADALGPIAVAEPTPDPTAATVHAGEVEVLAPVGQATPALARRGAPAVSGARVDAERGEVVLTLDSGARVSVPWILLPALAEAPVSARAGVEVVDDGSLLQWPALRLEVSVRALLQQALGLPA